jgi:LysM repeat protein
MIPTEILYIIKPGDTLSEIAQQYNTSYKQIAIDNFISNPNRIYANNQVKIFTSQGTWDSGSHGAPVNHIPNNQKNALNSSHSSDSNLRSKHVDSHYIGKHRSTLVGSSTSEKNALAQIIRRESGGNPYAHNPRSGTYGIGQLSPANIRKYGGSDINAVMRYIADRYGSAVAALHHHNTYGWY